MKIYKSNSVEDTASAAGELAAELLNRRRCYCFGGRKNRFR